MKSTRKIIKIDEDKCNGCGICVPSCAEGAIQVIDGKARLVAEKYCDGLGACLGECPEGALQVVDAEVEPFDESAAKGHVARQAATSRGEQNSPREAAAHLGKSLPCGCPSSVMRTFGPQTACDKANVPMTQAGASVSALTHWPVQIHLVPPTAPFLRGADLLVAADCTPVAYPRFHDDLLRCRTVLFWLPQIRRRRRVHQEIRRHLRNGGDQKCDNRCHGSPLLSGIAGDRPEGNGPGGEKHPAFGRHHFGHA